MRTGGTFLQGLRDERVVFVDGERVHDVAAHPAFAGAAATIARLFDLPDPQSFLVPVTSADLAARLRHHNQIAIASCGQLGRSPDHVAAMLVGLTMAPEALGDCADVLREYYVDARERNAYIAYAVLPTRQREGLRVVGETRTGLLVSGSKALATAGVFADEIWIGNLQPLASDRGDEALTCVVPSNAHGLQLLARPSYARPDGVLSRRFDEGDVVVVLDRVEIPWSRIFVRPGDVARSHEIYVRSPAHALANHQATVRSALKVRLMVGVADRLALESGSRQQPAVQALLGRLAALEATSAALVDAQVLTPETWPGGLAPRRRYVYAALEWCQQTLPIIVEALRELLGSAPFRQPEPTPTARLAWDLVGSEFAGRQQHYEHFYAGPPFVVREHNMREAPWRDLSALVDRAITPEENPS